MLSFDCQRNPLDPSVISGFQICSIFYKFLFEQDLEQNAAQYTGLARLYRLMFIADHCPSLRVEALRMALNYVMTTYNTNLYGLIHRKLQDAVSAWVAPYQL